MPNIKGGRNYKRGKKGKSQNKYDTPYADTPNLTYAQVKKKLGGNRIDTECSDGIPRQVIIPGSFYKKVWINPYDILLIQINELCTNEGYILYKYTMDEAGYLRQKGELTFNLNNNNNNNINKNIIFGTEYGDESNSDSDDTELRYAPEPLKAPAPAQAIIVQDSSSDSDVYINPDDV